MTEQMVFKIRSITSKDGWIHYITNMFSYIIKYRLITGGVLHRVIVLDTFVIIAAVLMRS